MPSLDAIARLRALIAERPTLTDPAAAPRKVHRG